MAQAADNRSIVLQLRINRIVKQKFIGGWVIIALLFLQSAQAVSVKKRCSTPVVIKQTFTAVGYGSTRNRYGQTTANRKGAMRAARVNAYQVLRKQVVDYRFDGKRTVGSMVKINPSLGSQIKSMLRGAEQVGMNLLGDGLYEARLQLVADRIFQVRTPCPKPDATTPWQRSLILEGEGKYQQARDALKSLFKKPLPQSDRELLLLRLGWLYYQTQEYNKSIRQYETALEVNPSSMDARLGILLPLLAQLRWYEVERYANQVLEQSPWNYLAHVRLLIAEEGMKKWERLENHARKLTQRYPGDVTVLVYLARSLLWQGKQREAADVYRQVLHRSPLHIEAKNYLKRK